MYGFVSFVTLVGHSVYGFVSFVTLVNHSVWVCVIIVGHSLIGSGVILSTDVCHQSCIYRKWINGQNQVCVKLLCCLSASQNWYIYNYKKSILLYETPLFIYVSVCFDNLCGPFNIPLELYMVNMLRVMYLKRLILNVFMHIWSVYISLNLR